MFVTPPLVKEGVTVIVAVFGEAVVFIAVKAPIFPVPKAAERPIEAFEQDQLNTVPGTEPLKTYEFTGVPLQTSVKLFGGGLVFIKNRKIGRGVI